MHEYVADAVVAISHAQSAAEEIITQIRELCGSITTDEAERLLDFEDGHAVIEANGEHLLLRVCARDPLIFYGIRTLLEGSLSMLALTPAMPVEWLPVDGIPSPGIGVAKPHATQRTKCK